jgi:hypothetical protein
MKSHNVHFASRVGRVCFAIVTVLALAATSVLAQTTGQVIGTVVDAQGGVLPGVTVTASSPQLQGTRTAITDGTGTFRFPTLPPGTYSIKANLAGFQDAGQENVTVSLDRSASLNLKMQVAGVSQTVNVLGTSPVVDTQSSAGGVTIDQSMLTQLPVARNFYSLARIAPGVTTDNVGATMLGSSGAENKYIIDGIDATGIMAGQQKKTLLLDFIDQVNVKTEGANAEYGGATGGVIEAITKSGANAFHGSAFAYGQGGGLIATNTTAALRPTTTTTVSSIDHQYDGGGTLGGFLVKDKLWFFGGYNPLNQQDLATVIRPIGTVPGTPGVGSTVPLKTTRNLYSGKLTYNVAQSQSLVFTVNGDPSKQEGNLFTISGPPSTWQGTLNSGAADFRVGYDGVFGNSWLFKAQAARHHELETYAGAGADTPLLIDATVNPNLRTGGFGGFENHDFKRDGYRADLTRYLGGHTLKGGLDYTKVDSLDNRFSGGGGQSITRRSSLPNGAGVVYYTHRYYVNDQIAGFSRTDPTTWKIALPLSSEPINKNTSAYVQDTWRVLPNFTIEGGVRWERKNLGDRFGNSVIDLKKNWAPRIGFTFDPMNDGKGKIFAHYGRYYEDIPTDINIRAFGGELQAQAQNFSPDPANLLPVSGTPGKNSLLGGSTEPVDPNLKNQHIDEFLVGFEREVAPNLSVGIKYNHRKLADVIEDFLVPSVGDYFIANPGQGTLGQSLGFYDGGSAPAPLATRTNDAVTVSATKRYSDNWQFIASYVWSKLEGNYDGTNQISTGQLDPNINSAFDYGDFLINAQGMLSNQRRHQFKVDGSYNLSKGMLNGLQFGLSTRWYSGLPLTAQGYSFAYSNWEYYLTPRGTLGFGPSDYEMDAHLAYPIKFGGGTSLILVGDVFNLLNRQAITQLDNRYNLQSGGHCSGVPDALCNGDGGLQHSGSTTNPIGQLTNPIATATNPDFLKAGAQVPAGVNSQGYTGQRALRLGIKLTF